MSEPDFDHDRLDVYRLSSCNWRAGQSLSDPLKWNFKRIVSMMTGMAMNFGTVSESPEVYTGALSCGHKYRDAEHE